jgi:hypothetical protein
MALTAYERQKRWREKHRALYNLRRRQARKNLSGVEGRVRNLDSVGESGCSGPPAQLSTVEKLRSLVATESAKPPIPDTPQRIYRDDYGKVVTEAQWRANEKRKADAKASGYEIDQYSQ